MKISLLSRIKAIFNTGVKSFDEKHPEVKIDAMVEHNTQIIKNAKRQIVESQVSQAKLKRDLEKEERVLKQYVDDLKRVHSENKDCSAYVQQVKTQEELVEKLKSAINKNDELYKQGCIKIKDIEDKNKSILVTKNVMLTKLAIAKLQENHLNLDTDGVYSADDVFEEVMEQVDRSDAKYNLEKDLGNIKEEEKRETSFSSDDVEEVIKKYS